MSKDLPKLPLNEGYVPDIMIKGYIPLNDQFTQDGFTPTKANAPAQPPATVSKQPSSVQPPKKEA